jgi:hypothetical protein
MRSTVLVESICSKGVHCGVRGCNISPVASQQAEERRLDLILAVGRLGIHF